MLGMSLVVGWYLTLPLAEKDGLPKETMANCYVVTALAALAGSRVLYVVTNLDEFKSVWDLFALRNGGLVAYGGFIGGLLGSWAFLAPKRIRLLAWADDAVPSLASGLLITRIGCYLFGCDFGKRLPDGAPAVAEDARDLSALGVGHARERRGKPGVRAPPRRLSRHVDGGGPHPDEHELPGAPDADLRVARRPGAARRSCSGSESTRASAGRSSSSSCSRYGFLRFLLELWRDDVERGSYGPTLDAHVYIPLCLLLLSLGFVFGISLGIVNTRARDRGARARVRAAGRRVPAPQAGELRADGALPAVDEPAHRRC